MLPPIESLPHSIKRNNGIEWSNAKIVKETSKSKGISSLERASYASSDRHALSIDQFRCFPKKLESSSGHHF